MEGPLGGSGPVQSPASYEDRLHFIKAIKTVEQTLPSFSRNGVLSINARKEMMNYIEKIIVNEFIIEEVSSLTAKKNYSELLAFRTKYK
ncbi:hypothetical protein DID80_06275 [Candidatus Marinamargulisbacteria bacterium SCGC AAA071-K20]|nr:hypothetical protein DID80_06275 [Candidatus Marinamargulisbacteria bacterium SCGC AAA071-K20]